MNLPDLAHQWIYARIGWGVVIAAIVLGLVPLRWLAPRSAAVGVTASIVTLMFLPGSASPAYWLGLVFQYPSVLLVACCAVVLWQRRAGSAARPLPPLAPVLALLGVFLYADAMGWLRLGIYARGFDPLLAPIGTLALGAAAVVSMRAQGWCSAASALLLCSVVFSLSRLPSGNLLDAMLDPLLWAWALCVALATLVRRVRQWRSRSRLPAVPGLNA